MIWLLRSSRFHNPSINPRQQLYINIALITLINELCRITSQSIISGANPTHSYLAFFAEAATPFCLQALTSFDEK